LAGSGCHPKRPRNQLRIAVLDQLPQLSVAETADVAVGVVVGDSRLRGDVTAVGNGAYFSRKEGKGANAFSVLEESYRLEVKVQADLKALGMTSCLGPPPRKLIVG